jgi:Lrp/AsnC family transcriptional regulator, leucine-responsive regulatory protein
LRITPSPQNAETEHIWKSLPDPRILRARRARIWHKTRVLDRFDLELLNEVQRDDGRTAEELAARVPLSPSAIARRLRRLRAEGWITRTVALLGSQLTGRRLRAIVLLQLSEHADQHGKAALLDRIGAATQVQFCYELAGTYDFVLLFDCATMEEFNEVAERILTADATVRRYETSFVKREDKFAPFVQLTAA